MKTIRRMFSFMNWGRQPSLRWYYDGSLGDMFRVRCFGHFWFHAIMAVIYFAVALVPLGWYWIKGDQAPGEMLKCRLFLVPWLIFTVLGLPLFIWLERLKFEEWIAAHPQLPPKPHRDEFEVNAKHMEAFWKAVATMYLTAGLFSFQLESPPPKAAPTQTEFQQLTQAVTLLANAVSKNAGVIPGTNPGSQKSDAGEPAKAAAEKQ